MGPINLSSRAFHQDANRARTATANGPVFITDRGGPTHVLLSIEDYRKLVGAGASIVDLLAPDETDDIDFDPPRIADELFRPADFTEMPVELVNPWEKGASS